LLLAITLLATENPGANCLAQQAPASPPGKAALQKLVQSLRRADFGEREEAQKRLVVAGEAAPEVLRQTAMNPDPEVRRRAEACIKEIDNCLLIARLVFRLQAKTPAERVKALRGFLEFGPTIIEGAAPALIRLLEDPDPEVRAEAMIVIGYIGPAAKAAVPKILALAEAVIPSTSLPVLPILTEEQGISALAGVSVMRLTLSWALVVLCLWVGGARAQDLAQPSLPPDAGSPMGSGLLSAPPVPRPTVELGNEAAESTGSFYSDFTFLLRWFKPVCLNVPVVSVGNPSAPVPGAIGQPGTQVVIGGVPPHKFDFGATPGGQLTAGWVSADGALGVEVTGFLMDTSSAGQGFTAAANGSPATYLPYQAPDNSQQALPFTIPGVVTGRSVALGSTHVWGVEANATLPFTLEREGWSFFGAFLAGARYLDLTDRDRITNTLQLVADPSAVAVGAAQFQTRNQFAGPQLGTVMGLEWGKLSLAYTTKLAAGLTHQSRNIEGAPLLATTDLSPLLVPGPLVALPSNIGRETADRVTLVPEAGIKSRLALTSWCSLSLGYTLIYWNKVLCPGDQMDGQVNITQLPFHGPMTGPPLPQPLFVHTDYFTQGLDVGLQFRF